MSAVLIGAPVPPAQAYDLVLLDLDGVVYVGPDAVPGAPEAIGRLREGGPRAAYVTNNASRPPETVAEHLTSLGVPATAADVVSSAQAAAAVLARRHPAGAPVLVVGGEGLYRALTAAGLTPVGSMDRDPVAVVQGFSPDVGWRLLAEGTRAVRSGLPWMATNTDLTVPTEHGPAPGNGTLVAAVATASGVRPEVAGKPQPTLFLEAAERYASSRPLVVGDRLDTDLEGARAARMDGLLVLTGVTRARGALLASAAERPHLISRDLDGLFATHPAPERLEDGRWGCGDAVAAVEAPDGGPARLVAARPGADPLDLLRAGCAAAWAHADGSVGAPVVPVDPADLIAALHRLDGAGPWGG